MNRHLIKLHYNELQSANHFIRRSFDIWDTCIFSESDMRSVGNGREKAAEATGQADKCALYRRINVLYMGG
ncbi:MAG: hypothetical protein LBF59_05160 [Prevotellaceae bacterium]|nr:hypothetical protein [Prevotellaceae bacterium]